MEDLETLTRLRSNLLSCVLNLDRHSLQDNFDAGIFLIQTSDLSMKDRWVIDQESIELVREEFYSHLSNLIIIELSSNGLSGVAGSYDIYSYFMGLNNTINLKEVLFMYSKNRNLSEKMSESISHQLDVTSYQDIIDLCHEFIHIQNFHRNVKFIQYDLIKF